MHGFNRCHRFDYVVVGSGSAGSVLAARLSDDGKSRVLLLEAGPPDRSIWFHVPIGYYKIVGNARFDWGYASDAEEGLHGRRISVPRGRVVGGCGAVNGLGYIRGQKSDYDRWKCLGNAGWGWSDVEPYFRLLEGHRGSTQDLGRAGPIGLTPLTERLEICEAFLDAAESCGLPRRPHLAGADHEGASYLLTTVENGLRTSSARSYLRPALRRDNLHLESGAHCEAILFDGRRATGVRYRKNGRSVLVKADVEVVLCAGTVNSPQLLQLSGVGPAPLLRSLGIEVISDLSGVGRNLQEHFTVECKYQLNSRISWNDVVRNPLWRLRAGFRWALSRDGPLTTSPAHITAFARSEPQIERPDLQFHFIPLSLDENRSPERISGVSLDVYQMRPLSRGTINICSKNPADKPSIQFRFLSNEYDKRVILAGLRLARRITKANVFSSHVEMEILPGEDVSSDEELLEFARSAGFTDYHLSGTCSMGTGNDAVVDHRLRVNGVERLRVADCSVIPEMVSGNTNACAMMIAEKAADMIKEDARLHTTRIGQGRCNMTRTLSIIGAPSSAGAYAPGQEKTPDAMRSIGFLEMLREKGVRVSDLGNTDRIRWQPDPANMRAMNVDKVIMACRQTAKKVATAYRNNSVACVLGGDCTLEFGTVSGLASECGNVGLIYVDLDPDMQTQFSTDEGALDWMGVAHMLDLPGVVEDFATSGPRTPLIHPEALRLFMVDNARPFEEGHIGSMSIACDYASAVLKNPHGAGIAAAEWAEQFDCVAIHLDIDVLNFGQMPLAENTRKRGVPIHTLMSALTGIMTAKNIAAFTLTEVNPDHGAEDGSTLRQLADELSNLFAGAACLASNERNTSL